MPGFFPCFVLRLRCPFAAVLCTAGSVEVPSDPIVCDRVAETDSSVSYAVFENEGTSYFAEAAAGETDKDAWVLTGTCSWTAAEPKGTYTLTFADGRAETAMLDAEHGLMTIGEVVYEKYPSGFSGAVPKLVVGAAYVMQVQVLQAYMFEATEMYEIKDEQFGADIIFDT